MPVIVKPPSAPTEELEFLEPVVQQSTVAERHIWKSKCGRYRIGRSISKLEGGDNSFGVFQRTRNVEREVKLNLRSLDSCFDAVLRFHQEHINGEAVISNQHEILGHAEAAGLATLPRHTVVDGNNSYTVIEGPAPRIQITSGKKEGKRYNFHGHPITGVLRWMGANGWTNEQAMHVLTALGLETAKATVYAQIRAGVKQERGAPADLTKEQVQELTLALEAQ